MPREIGYIGEARTPGELDSARLLAARVLGGANLEEAAGQKSAVWAEPGFPGADHVVVAASKSGAIHGVVRLVPRVLRHADEALRIAGISSVAVDEDYRKRGVASRLMDASLQQAAALGYELTVLFARRAVDHFYPRFDIWGVASYSRVSMAALPSGGEAAIERRPMGLGDLTPASRWHAGCYGDCFGWIERSLDHWQFLLDGAGRRGLSLVIGLAAGAPVGYAVLRGQVVIEIGFDEPAHALGLVRALSTRDGPLQCELPRGHRLFSVLDGADFTVSSRRCEYGGHMVGVVNRAQACSRLARRIERHATAVDLGPRQEHIDGLLLDWDGRSARVQIDTPAGQPALGLRTTARLVGAELAGTIETSSLAPATPLDFQALDEF